METMRQMEAMMDNMMSPFNSMFGAMGSPFAAIAPHQQSQQRRYHNGSSLMPFGFGRSLFPNVDDMFANFQQIAQNPDCHSFSSSSVMTLTTDEHGRPQVYQASASTRTGPGGMKETRRSVQDSRTGLQEMAIGHHLDERAHIIGRKRNRYTGEEDENQEFINLEEEEAESFNREWQQKAQGSRHHPQYSSLQYNGYGYGGPRREEPLAITAGPSEPNSRKRDIEESDNRPKSEHRHKRKSKPSKHRPKHETSM